MKAFKVAFHEVVPESALDDATFRQNDEQLQLYYLNEFLPRLNANSIEPRSLLEFWPEDESSRLLQHLYFVANHFQTGDKHLLDQSSDASTYT